MNPLTLLLYVLLVVPSSTAPTQVQTILEADTSETIDAQVLNTLKDQLQERMDQSEFKPATVELIEASGQLVVTATVNIEDEEALAAYRSLFTSTSLGLWNTYRVDDDGIVEWVQDIGPIKNFYFNGVERTSHKLFDQELILQPSGRGNSAAALGVCRNEADKAKILQHLEPKARSLPDLKLLWSPLTVDRYTEEAYYILFMIKTNGLEEAPLMEKHIADTRAYREDYTNEIGIGIQFNEEGTAIWADMTQTAALNNQRSIAIVLNDVVLSAPMVINEISSGEMRIVSDFSMEEASDLARKLELGRLAYPLKVVSERMLNEKE